MSASPALEAPPPSAPADDDLTATFRRVGPAMFRQALALLGDRAAAEDVVQEAFLRTWRRRERVRDPAALDGYLVQAARHLALDHLRWRERRPAPPEDAGDPLVLPRTEDAAALAERLSRALHLLPPEQREVVLLHLIEGRTFPEVAARTGAPLGTVHSRYRVALARLRERLEDVT
ncbi:MAG: RNA polymerase sigma factor [Planctomycetes bacterium]|nr:RNA polymerase sigma factor [Planctomycetota bacterium]